MFMLMLIIIIIIIIIIISIIIISSSSKVHVDLKAPPRALVLPTLRSAADFFGRSACGCFC